MARYCQAIHGHQAIHGWPGPSADGLGPPMAPNSPHLWTYWVGGVKKTNYMEKDNTRWLREVPNWKNEAGHGPSVWGDHVSMLRLISSNI